ncbi:MAG: hypothetical protein ACLQCB_18915 [Spirochaetia bacterium]
MDALAPALESYAAACAAGADFPTAPEAMTAAAERGKESTRAMGRSMTTLLNALA